MWPVLMCSGVSSAGSDAYSCRKDLGLKSRAVRTTTIYWGRETDRTSLMRRRRSGGKRYALQSAHTGQHTSHAHLHPQGAIELTDLAKKGVDRLVRRAGVQADGDDTVARGTPRTLVSQQSAEATADQGSNPSRITRCPTGRRTPHPALAQTRLRPRSARARRA